MSPTLSTEQQPAVSSPSASVDHIADLVQMDEEHATSSAPTDNEQHPGSGDDSAPVWQRHPLPKTRRKRSKRKDAEYALDLVVRLGTCHLSHLHPKHHLKGGANWQLWRHRVGAALTQRNLLRYVDGKVRCPREPAELPIPKLSSASPQLTLCDCSDLEMSISPYHVVDKFILGWLQQQMDACLITTVSPFQSARALMHHLAASFAPSDSSRNQLSADDLRKQLNDLALVPLEKITREQANKFISTVDDLAARIAELGATIPDPELGLLVLQKIQQPLMRSILLMQRQAHSWAYVKALMAIVASANDKRGHRQTSPPEQQLCSATLNRRNKPAAGTSCDWCRARKDRHLGHLERDCRKKRRAESQRRATEQAKRELLNSLRSTSQSSPTEEAENISKLLAQLEDCKSIELVIDSGATTHVFGNREDHLNDLTGETTTVQVADGREISVENLNKPLTLLIENNSQRISLDNVKVSANLNNKNYYSVSKGADVGINVLFTENKAILFHAQSKNRIATATRRGNLYVLPATMSAGPESVNSLQYSNIASAKVWHERLAHRVAKAKLSESLHANTFGFKISKTSESDTDDSSNFCRTCVEGKSTRLPFKSSKRVDKLAKRPLGRIALDLHGPTGVLASEGERYFMVIIDQATQFVQTFCLRKKSEAHSAFLNYVKRSENQLEQRVKIVRFDGGENDSCAMHSFLTKKGIVFERTVPHSSQQNGACERAIRTLSEMSTCLLQQAGAPLWLWREAIYHATSIHNIIPSNKHSSHKTPYELWHGHKPDLSRLRIFGCEAYMNVPKRSRATTFSPKVVHAVYLGECPNAKGYILYHCSNRKFLPPSRDARFNESTFPFRQMDATDPIFTHETGAMGFDDDYFPSDTDSAHKSAVAAQSLGRRNRSVNRTHRKPAAGRAPLSTRAPPTEVAHHSDQMMTQDQAATPPNEPPRTVDERDCPSAAPDPCTHDNSRSPSTNNRARPKRRRSSVNRYVPEATGHHLNTAALNSSSSDNHPIPKSVHQALKSADANSWRQAMLEELRTLKENDTWTLVPPPPNRKIVGSTWAFKREVNPDGSVRRFKARLCARGDTQIAGVDYEATFAPVARFTTFRVLMALAAHQDLDIWSVDVKGAYLYGKMDREMYMRQPPGFSDPCKPDHVCLLNKSLYGCCQSGSIWHSVLHGFLTTEGFTQSEADECMYFQRTQTKQLFVVLVFVDDMLLITLDHQAVAKLKAALRAQFTIHDLGSASQFLNIEILRDRPNRRILLRQSGYIATLLSDHEISEQMASSTPALPHIRLRHAAPDDPTGDEVSVMHSKPYRELVGSLMYLAQRTRPDILYAVQQVSQFQSQPTMDHWEAARHILKYLCGSPKHGLLYSGTPQHISGNFSKGPTATVATFTDSGWMQDTETCKSVGGHVFLLFGGTVDYSCKKFAAVALSSTEAEWYAACSASRNALWIHMLLRELDIGPPGPVRLYEDNNGVIAFATKSACISTMRHIHLRHRFLRQQVKDNLIELVKVPTSENVADIFTKPLARGPFRRHRDRLNVHPWPLDL